jgi:hypothetical protein
VLLLNSCKKEISNGGLSLLNIKNDDFGSIDTFALKVGSTKVDTVNTSNPSYLMLGSYVDPVFGKYDAGFYAQARISALKPDFGDLTKISVDSLILGMRFSDYYGKLDAQNFEVYELSEDLIATKSYNTQSSIAVKSDNLVLQNEGNITPKPYGYKFTEFVNDTIRDNIRIQLNPNLALRFITDSKINPANFATMDAFLSYFKGLYVKVSNVNQQSGEGGVMSFAYPPVLTIYYKLDGVRKKFYFELNASGVRFNHVTCDYAGTDVEKLVLGQLLDQKDFYAQSNHVRGTVNLTTIKDLPNNSIVHFAKLILPVDYTSTNVYRLSSEIFVSIPNSISDPTLRYITSGYLDTVYHGYVVDLRDHIQQVITGKRLNNSLVFSPKFFSLSAERIHFIGPNTLGTDKPRLLIKYSTF